MILVKRKHLIILITAIVVIFILTQWFVYTLSIKTSNKVNLSYEKELLELVDEPAKEIEVRVGSIKDIELLQKIVMAEASGEPLEGQIAVANVILNRVNSSRYPNTIEEVVFQSGQFNPTWDGSLERNKEISLSVKLAVNRALSGQQMVPENTFFFLNEDIATDFTIPDTRTYVNKIGNHTFYR